MISFLRLIVLIRQSSRHKLSKSASCIICSSLLLGIEPIIVARIIHLIFTILSSLQPIFLRYSSAILAQITSFFVYDSVNHVS